MWRFSLFTVLFALGACASSVPPAVVPAVVTPAPIPVPLPAPVAVPVPVVPAPPAPQPASTVPPQDFAALCNAQPDPAFETPIPAGALDRPLLDRAILFHTNRVRCGAGLPPLGPDPALRSVATGHSADMVRLGFFGHTSPVAGRTTMGDRLRSSGVPFRTAAENLATAGRLAIRSGQPVFPLAQRCAYSLTPNGPRVPVRTYDALALNLVERWVESPGHRANLMNPAYTRHGASGVIDPSGQLCESVSATQLFAG